MPIAATTLSTVLVVTAVLLFGLVLVLVFFKRPWWGAVVALGSLALVPFWFGLQVGFFFISVHLVLMAAAALAIFLNRTVPIRFSLVDIILLGLLALSVFSLALRLTTLTQTYTFAQEMTVYAFARLAAASYGTRRVFTVLAITFPVVAVTMFLESATGINVWQSYLALNNGLYGQWSHLQSRGGVLRAEGPFGHSIAAGSSLAVVAILALDARLKMWIRAAIVAVLVCGILVTISRIGMVTAALGLALAVVFARSSLSRAAKVAVLCILSAGAAVYALVLRDIFADSGSEAVNSAAYRLWLLDLLPLLQPIGYASGYSQSTDGASSFGTFGSIDNAVLAFALKNGWVPAAVLILLMLAAVVRLLTLRGGVATAAVVAQLPALFTVATITTYGLVFWLSVGLAVSEAVGGTRFTLEPRRNDHESHVLKNLLPVNTR